MKEIYLCEKCKKPFNNMASCLDHEMKCNPVINHQCVSCDKKESYQHSNESWINENLWHTFTSKRIGFGSQLDGSCVKFEICDDCLASFSSKTKESNECSYYHYQD